MLLFVPKIILNGEKGLGGVVVNLGGGDGGGVNPSWLLLSIVSMMFPNDRTHPGGSTVAVPQVPMTSFVTVSLAVSTCVIVGRRPHACGGGGGCWVGS